jgi:hypothetical protein
MASIWENRLSLRQRLHVMTCRLCRRVRVAGLRALAPRSGGYASTGRFPAHLQVIAAIFVATFVLGGLLWRDIAGRNHLLAAQRSAEQQRLTELQQQRSRVSDLQRQLDQVTAESRALDEAVQAYVARHPEATTALVAGIGGGNLALDSNNEYTQEARAAGLFAASLAVAWASQHMDEVQEVLAELNRASTQKKQYAAQIEQLTNSISEQQARLRDLESRAGVPVTP